MPQQLIYTSAPRGIIAGRSGYCTVARSAGMREALGLRLEQLSYYQHLLGSGARERPIFAHRIIDIRGARFHVLSRIQDAGLDFTGRTNFLAHHLAVTPEERAALPSPPLILRDWNGWVKQWTMEPQLLEHEDWATLIALATGTSLPAQTWQQLTGDAVNGYGLLELDMGTVLRVNGHPDATVLSLMAESLELLEVRDIRHDWRTAAWQFTFTTSLQERDNPADFRWRCVPSDAQSRTGAADSRPLSAITAAACTSEEAALARTGRQPPRFVVEPENIQISEGDTARLQAKADGVPSPTYQWFKIDRENNGQPVDGAIHPELVLVVPPRGLSRYALRIQNSAGEVISRTIVLSVELKSTIVGYSTGAATQLGEPKERHQKTGDEIDQQRQRLETERNRRMYGKPLLLVALVFGILAAAALILVLQQRRYRAVAQNTVVMPKTAVAKLEGPQPSQPSQAQPTRLLVSPLASNDARLPPLEAAITNAAVNSNVNVKGRMAMLPAEIPTLPPGWVARRIGKVARPNCQYLPDTKPPTAILSAATDGFDETGDNLFFACHTNSQTEFFSQLLSIEPATPGSWCGIMVRESATTNSAFLFIGASSESLLVCRRDAEGGFYINSNAKPPDPLWLRLSEANGQFAASWSSDEKHGASRWFDSQVSLPLKKRSLIGFAVASGNLSRIVQARFAMANPKREPRANAE